jgi:hypothetical protein
MHIGLARSQPRRVSTQVARAAGASGEVARWGCTTGYEAMHITSKDISVGEIADPGIPAQNDDALASWSDRGVTYDGVSTSR